MKILKVTGIGLLLFAVACSSDKEGSKSVETWPESGMTNARYINNGQIQLGIDMQRGGAVFHFSEVNTKRNLLNHVDEGRFMQQSYYGEKDGSTWNGSLWVWNPIQGGGSHGEKAEVVSSNFTSTTLQATTIPVHWATGKALTACRMIENIALDGRIAHIRYVFSNRGTEATDHPATSQELPAVFVDWDLKNYVFYNGAKPWTNDAVTQVIPARLDLTNRNEERDRTEEWSAYVDDSGWGIGVYTPGSFNTTTYRFGAGPGGANMGSCSYFAPIQQFAITKGLIYQYDVYLMIGTVTEIRAAFYKIHSSDYSK